MTPTWDDTNPVDAAEPDWDNTTPAEVGALDTSKLKISPYEQAKLEGRDEGPYAGGEGARQRNLEEAGALYASLLEPPMRIPRIEATSTAGKLAAAPVNVASGLLESIASPVGLATLPLLEAKAAAPLIKGVFGSLAVRDAAQRLGEASVTRDPGQAAEGFLTGALGGIALPEGTLAGLYRAAKSPIERARIDRTIRRAEEAIPPREPVPETPVVPEPVPETPIEEPKGEPNAVPVGEPAPLPVAETPGSSEEVGARISGAEEPANAQGEVLPEREQVPEEVAPVPEPVAAAKPATNWELFNEELADNLDSFSPARDTGKIDYDLRDVADRFTEYAKADTSGKPVHKLVSDFAKVDEASDSQIRKLRQAVKAISAQEPVAPVAEAAPAPVVEEVKPKSLTEAESVKLAELTNKLDTNQKLTAAESKRYRALLDKAKAQPEIAEKPQVESGMEGPGSPSITQPPDPATMGLDTGSPIYNRIKAHYEMFTKGIRSMYQRGASKDEMALAANQTDTLPGSAANRAKNGLVMAIPKPADRSATTLVMQALKMSPTDPVSYLNTKAQDMVTAAQVFRRRGSGMDRLQAEGAAKLAITYKHAADNFPHLVTEANEAKGRFDSQFSRDQAAGLTTDYEQWYVPQRWDMDLLRSGDGSFIVGGGGKTGNSSFKKSKVFPDYASAIEYAVANPGEYFIPRTLDVSDLLQHRVLSSERQIAKASYFSDLGASGVTDPATGQPVFLNVARGKEPRGYTGFEVMPGKFVAIHNGYEPMFRALFGRSGFAGSAPIEALRSIAAVEKSAGLALDTFHLSRVLQGGLALANKLYLGKTLKKGLALSEYSPADLRRAVASGAMDPEVADYALTPITMEVHGAPVTMTRYELVQNLMKHGLNNGRSVDAIYKEWIHEMPLIGKTLHGVNKFVFDQMSRSAINDSAQIEFQRIAKARPDMTGDQVAKEVAKNINAFFGNIGKESPLKNPETRTLLNVIFLAPNWVYSLAAREVMAAKNIVGLPIDAIRGRPVHMASAAKGIGTGLASYFLATQLLNLYTRHHLTIDNPEEGHKMDAWIPDFSGKGGKGFFISPLSVFGEITHDIIRLRHTKGDYGSAIDQIAMNKLGNLGRAIYTFGAGRDPLSHAKLTGLGSRAANAAVQLAPLPIIASTPGRMALSAASGGRVMQPPQGAVQRQLTASMGFKTEAAPSAQNELYTLAREWMASSKDPKVQAQYAEKLKHDDPAGGPFRDLKMALRNDDVAFAARAYKELLVNHKPENIKKSFTTKPLYTGSNATDKQFYESLNPYQKELYTKGALQERQDLYKKFSDMMKVVYKPSLTPSP